jgi:hypothetical protein
MLRRAGVVAAVVFLGAPAAAGACSCSLRAADQAAVERVQSSWMSGYSSIQAGDYARALRALRSSAASLRFIRDRTTRACVAAGANNLIASAAAGEAYLARHRADAAGAKVAAERARQVFLSCPR